MTVSRIKKKAIAAANSHATTDIGSGAIAILRVANVEIIRRSAIEDITTHAVGRSPVNFVLAFAASVHGRRSRIRRTIFIPFGI